MGGDSEAMPNGLSTFESLRDVVKQLKYAVKKRDYDLTIRHTTTAIDQILEPLILSYLDIRAYTHATQGKIQLALKDVERMIEHAPGEPDGYLRKAEIFSMYGRQTCAIEAYDDGLSNVAADHKRVRKLDDGRAKAVADRNKTVDFFALLPSEITSNITSRLPQATITACLMTSKPWRLQVLRSTADVWRSVSINEEHDSHLISTAPFVGRFVENLVINTANKGLRDACFRAIKNGHLSEIRKLKITAVSCDNLRHSIATISNALWQARNTLKFLDIDLDMHANPITLSDILLSCNTTTDIFFSCKSSKTALSGDYTELEMHHSLTNLQLTADTIKRKHIEGVLQRCQQLRRLVMCGCDPTVLESVNKYATNLEILGYNCTGLVPELAYGDPQPGLRVLYTNDGGTKVPIENLFPLIYRNMGTLEDLQAVLSSPTELELQQFFANYRDLKLENMKRLVVWPQIRVQPLIMRAIRGVLTLKHLHVVEPFQTDPLFKAVMRLPPLTTLGITHARTKTGRSSLIQMFRTYAQFSATGNSLRSVQFRYCDEIDDSVLAALAGIKTLDDVTLCSLDDVTTAGINSFLEKTRDLLKNLALAEMSSITDPSLIILTGSTSLTTVELDSLPNVTDQGICDLIESQDFSLAVVKVDGCVLTPN
ncbi:hypothetical protein BJV82DRAFT_711761 [Fennellomyces sp. T-0311]|nr:hypothetical protein BJV82DRAFT_711761 [Fennellomyces sp. T-0311]